MRHLSSWTSDSLSKRKTVEWDFFGWFSNTVKLPDVLWDIGIQNLWILKHYIQKHIQLLHIRMQIEYRLEDCCCKNIQKDINMKMNVFFKLNLWWLYPHYYITYTCYCAFMVFKFLIDWFNSLSHCFLDTRVFINHVTCFLNFLWLYIPDKKFYETINNGLINKSYHGLIMFTNLICVDQSFGTYLLFWHLVQFSEIWYMIPWLLATSNWTKPESRNSLRNDIKRIH